MSKQDYPTEAVIDGVVVAGLPPAIHGNCPVCGTDLNGGGIWLHFFHTLQSEGYWLDEDGAYLTERRILTPQEAAEVADKIAENYGADRTKGRWGRAIGLVQNDRCGHYACPDCKAIWDARTGEFTGKFFDTGPVGHA